MLGSRSARRIVRAYLKDSFFRSTLGGKRIITTKVQRGYRVLFEPLPVKTWRLVYSEKYAFLDVRFLKREFLPFGPLVGYGEALRRMVLALSFP